MKRIVTGVLILLLGIFLLFYNLDIISYSLYRLVISWQSLLIAIGVVILFDRKGDAKEAGIILILVGTVFLFPKAFSVSLGGILVPLLIMLAGIYFIVRTVIKRNRNNSFSEHGNYEDLDQRPFVETSLNQEGIIRREYVFAGSKERLAAGKIKGADINAVFSGVEIDFSQLELSEEANTIYIKVQSVFSGVTLFVPEEWNLIIQKTGVFGGFADKRQQKPLNVIPGKTVVLDLEAVFGGGEIKTYE